MIRTQDHVPRMFLPEVNSMSIFLIKRLASQDFRMLDGYVGPEGSPGPLDSIGHSAQSPLSCSVPRETTFLMNLEKAPLCAPGGVLQSAGYAHARVWCAWVYVHPGAATVYQEYGPVRRGQRRANNNPEHHRTQPAAEPTSPHVKGF